MRTSFDIIIIGSGPAGCSAAATLVQAGLNVVIVTEEKELTKADVTPQPLESIHPGVSSLLDKFGAADAAMKASRAIYSGIYAGDTYTPLGEDSEGAWQGVHINRQIFNNVLLQCVRDLGVNVRFNERVDNFIVGKAGGRSERSRDPAIDEVNTSGVIGIRSGSTELYATYIIDASGKKAIAGKKLNFRRQFYSPPLLCWTGVSERIETFPFDPKAAHFIPGDGGWSWLAPQPPHYCAWTRLSATGDKSLAPPDELKNYTTIGKIQFANMRWRLYRPVCSEGVVLCGDAAGILDPAAGQGIFNALWSGIVAANTGISCLREPTYASIHLAYYDDWFVQQFELKVKQLREYYEEHGISIFNK